MSYIKQIIVVFILIIISLAFAQHDFSGIEHGYIINFFGYLSAIGIPFGFVMKIINDMRSEE